MKASRMLPLACALALGCAGAWSQSGGATNQGSSMTGGKAAPAAQAGTGTRMSETRKDDKLSRGDRKFVENAAASGMFEVQAAKIAASKASDPAVKDFASKLLQDHEQANNELVKLANARHVELPAAPSRGNRHAIEQLGKMEGAEFDKVFVKEVGLEDHREAIEKFEKAAKDLKDPDVKAWVQETLPHLREHYAMAQKLEAGKGNAAAMGNR